MKKLFTIASRVIFTSVILGTLFILGSLLPISGNYEFRVVESGSMEPALKTASVVAIVPRAAYQAGDIVTFSGTPNNPTPTTHRLIEQERADGQLLWVTKGDANEEVDHRRISESDILGKVFVTIPYAGYITRFMGTPDGIALAVTAILLILLVPPLSKYLRGKQTKHVDTK